MIGEEKGVENEQRQVGGKYHHQNKAPMCVSDQNGRNGTLVRAS